MLNNPAVLSCLQTDSGNGDYLPIHHIGNQYISLCTLEDGDLFHQGRDAISAGFLTGPGGWRIYLKQKLDITQWPFAHAGRFSVFIHLTSSPICTFHQSIYTPYRFTLGPLLLPRTDLVAAAEVFRV